MVIYHSIKAESPEFDREKNQSLNYFNFKPYILLLFFFMFFVVLFLLIIEWQTKREALDIFLWKMIGLCTTFAIIYQLYVVLASLVFFFFQNQLWLYVTSNAKSITFVIIYLYDELWEVKLWTTYNLPFKQIVTKIMTKVIVLTFFP